VAKSMVQGNHCLTLALQDPRVDVVTELVGRPSMGDASRAAADDERRERKVATSR
jgi:hypothetical protein